MSNRYLNATRMELSRLRDQLTTTIRGHKLLKDKQDELMRNFTNMISEFRELNEDTKTKLQHVFKQYLKAVVQHDKNELDEKTKIPARDVSLNVDVRTIMSTPLVTLAVKDSPFHHMFSSFNTTPALKLSLVSLNDLLPQIIKLAELNKNIELLILEIEKVKRRVNAIEHIMIPELEVDIKTIKTKLSEQELSSTVRTMKAKEMVIDKLRKPRS